MVSREGAKKGKKDGEKEKKVEEDEGGESWDETYRGLVKVVEREGRHVKI